MGADRPQTTPGSPLRVELAAVPRCFLYIAQNAGGFEVAVWRIRNPMADPAVDAPAMPFAAAVERGDIPKGAKRSAWVRRAGRGPDLSLVLDELLGGSGQDARTVAEYVKARLQAVAS